MYNILLSDFYILLNCCSPLAALGGGLMGASGVGTKAGCWLVVKVKMVEVRSLVTMVLLHSLPTGGHRQ